MDISTLQKPDTSTLRLHAQHEESFLSVLNFAEDARALADMLIRLQETQAHLVIRINQSLAEREVLGKQYADLQTVLDTKRGELKFGDVMAMS